MNKGVVYVATGESYCKEAIKSAGSLKKYMPNLPITLFTDNKNTSPYFNNQVLLTSPTHTIGDKIYGICNSPYEKTLYLDTDTYICDDLSDIFSLLKMFDLAATRAPMRFLCHRQDLPNCFTELNCGLILFKKSDRVLSFLNQWKDCYEELKCEAGCHDQHSFRLMLLKSDLRFYILPPEYNCRACFPVFIHGKVFVVHSRHKNIGELASIINRNLEMRVYMPNIGLIQQDDTLLKLLAKRISMNLHNPR